MTHNIIERLFTEADLRAAICFYRVLVDLLGHTSEDAITKTIDKARQTYDVGVELYDAGYLNELPDGEKALRALYKDGP